MIKQIQIPEDKVGIAKVERFTVDENSSAMSIVRKNYVPKGEYTRLYVDGILMMSNTPMEIRTNHKIIKYSHGKVLIAGLGIGVILAEILEKENVTSVVVVEKYQDVIDLILPHFMSDKLNIICTDIMEWKPSKGEVFDTIYFDIWPDICTDNLDDMRKLHNKAKYWKNKDNPGVFVDSWMRDELKRKRRREKAYVW